MWLIFNSGWRQEEKKRQRSLIVIRGGVSCCIRPCAIPVSLVYILVSAGALLLAQGERAGFRVPVSAGSETVNCLSKPQILKNAFILLFSYLLIYSFAHQQVCIEHIV